MSDSDFTIPISHTQESNTELGNDSGYKILRSGDLLRERYSILREIGSGGFATTYLAIDQKSKTKTRCVVKQLQPRINSPVVWANAKERLTTEATVLRWLGNHDRIPQLLAHFEENKQFYLVLEFIEGEELEQEVQRQVLTEPEVVEFLIEVLKILSFVHQQGVIHRDIKPSNLIRRRKDGKFTLIDFGAVKEIGTLSFDSHHKPIETQIIGTPGYMPPEQHHGKPIYSSDLYALGKTAIFALTGRSPIEWEFSETQETPNWRDEITIGKALTTVIERMTAPKIADRYHSANKVLQDLKPMLAVGKILAEHYYINEYLGSRHGVYSYLVRNLEPDNPSLYNLEILQPQKPLINWNSALEQIDCEIANLAKLEDLARVPKIIEYLTDRQNLYLIQEYVEGESLEEIIARQQKVSETEIIDLIIDAAEILATIHQQNIIHGNINPASLIQRSSDGKLILMDFGSIHEVLNLFPGNQSLIPQDRDKTQAKKPNLRLDLDARGKHRSRDEVSSEFASSKQPPHSSRTNFHKGHEFWNFAKRAVRPDDGYLEWDLLSQRALQNELFEANLFRSFEEDPQVNSTATTSDLSDFESFEARSRHHPFSRNDLPAVPLGQTDYIAPEQIAGSKVFASDIYALGMTAIHLLTGVAPSNLPKNPRTGEMLWQKQASIDSRFAEILNKMVCLDKRKRYHSATKLIRDLNKIKDKSSFRSWLKYILIVTVLSGVTWFGLVQWAQRVAILEFYKGDIKLEAKQYREAIEYYDNGLEKLLKTRGIVKNFEQVWLKKARALNQLNNYEAVIDTCSNALKYYQSHRLWNCKALALDSLKHYEAALDAYNRALALNSDSPWVWNNRGEVYAEIGNNRAAIADFQKAIELDAERSFVPWNNLGRLHYQQKDYQRAIEAYQQALLIKEDYLPAIIGMGNAKKNQGEYSEALQSYNKAIELDSNSYEAWYGKGLVEESLQQYREARKAYQKAFSLKPDWETVIKALQRVERKIGS